MGLKGIGGIYCKTRLTWDCFIREKYTDMNTMWSVAVDIDNFGRCVKFQIYL